ncbi:MAG: hypothetical protein A3I83_01085 [Methylotenera sp. RIFCSPLOWO2_02_FULL_45_14]|nr:MAG: hypothetical protein A3I83_01085 [Methylotenera sp. RIFCSPLOWO2_02_FULL_45_14]
MSSFNHLISGHDTIECAYYLMREDGCILDFEALAVQKEELVRSKIRKPKAIKLGCEEFLLASHGTGSGYSFLIENDTFSIQFGEFNNPNFYVTYRSIALWHEGAFNLHQRFLDWAKSLGLTPYKAETLSRVDFTFDYYLPAIDFDADNFITAAIKDNQYRKDRKVQTFNFGAGDTLLRVYNKCDEITETSAKTWFYDIWGIDHDVWRIEWQIRKDRLRTVGIKSFEDLKERQGDLLRILVKDHTTLRIKADDSNRSRWPLHPLWLDLIERVNQMEGLGIVRELDALALLEERFTRIAISVYGYIKRVAAIDALYTGVEKSYVDEAFTHLQNKIMELHDPLTWQNDVNKRVEQMRIGE